MGVNWLLFFTCLLAVAHADTNCPSTLSNIDNMCTSDIDAIYTIYFESDHYPECGANITGTSLSDNVREQPHGIKFKEANSVFV